MENKEIKISEESLEKFNDKVKHTYYGEENELICKVFNSFPQNTDRNIVAMKISLIDVTNSTHLALQKHKISLSELTDFIINIHDFDKCVEQGDPELVKCIAKNNGSVNLFSFASKYCAYHNTEIYKRDDYSIYDSIVHSVLPQYKKGLTKSKIESWREAYDYKSFNRCIEEILDENEIQIPFRRRKFDYFLWYPNR